MAKQIYLPANDDPEHYRSRAHNLRKDAREFDKINSREAAARCRADADRCEELALLVEERESYR